MISRDFEGKSADNIIEKTFILTLEYFYSKKRSQDMGPSVTTRLQYSMLPTSGSATATAHASSKATESAAATTVS